LLSERYPMAH